MTSYHTWWEMQTKLASRLTAGKVEQQVSSIEDFRGELQKYDLERKWLGADFSVISGGISTRFTRFWT